MKAYEMTVWGVLPNDKFDFPPDRDNPGQLIGLLSKENIPCVAVFPSADAAIEYAKERVKHEEYGTVFRFYPADNIELTKMVAAAMSLVPKHDRVYAIFIDVWFEIKI